MFTTLGKGAAFARGERPTNPAAKRYALVADEELAALVKEGDAQALAALYGRYAHAAYALAYRIAGRQLDTEDLVQDAFLKVWRSAKTYDTTRGSVRSWILAIVHNLTIDRLRSAATRRKLYERLEAAAIGYQGEAFEEVWGKACKEQLREALETLPPEQLEVVEMSYFSGYAHAEISRLLGLSLGTVKSRLRLGVKRMRVHLRAQGQAASM